ncbi:MAG: 6-phosphogluconate dehydrogenase, decarboxylating, partial [uncultured Rubrobacteraceae bacterium]
ETGDDRPRQDGRQHDPAPARRRAHGGRVGEGPQSRKRAGHRRRHGRGVSGGRRGQARSPARRVDDGPLRRPDGGHGTAARRATRRGRHRSRWREQQLPRHHPPGGRPRREGHRLRGRRHQRWHLGAHGGLLHDGWGRGRGRRASEAGPVDAGARERQGLGARRAFGVRALRQDGPQRHRVRHDAGLRRGLRAHAAQGGVRARP